jgi:NDP-sugar pyrophosphorylase family protein
MTELIATNNRLNMLNGVDFQLEEDVTLVDTTISGYSTIGSSVACINSTVENSIVYDNSVLENCHIKDSIIGKNCVVKNFNGKINLGNFSVVDYV